MVETIDDRSPDGPDGTAPPVRTALVLARRRKARPVAEVARSAHDALVGAGMHAEVKVVRRKRSLRRSAREAVDYGWMVELDGAEVGRTRVRIRVRPAALRVMVPAS